MIEEKIRKELENAKNTVDDIDSMLNSSDINADSLDNNNMANYFDRVMTMVEKDL